MLPGHPKCGLDPAISPVSLRNRRHKHESRPTGSESSLLEIPPLLAALLHSLRALLFPTLPPSWLHLHAPLQHPDAVLCHPNLPGLNFPSHSSEPLLWCLPQTPRDSRFSSGESLESTDPMPGSICRWGNRCRRWFAQSHKVHTTNPAPRSWEKLRNFSL